MKQDPDTTTKDTFYPAATKCYRDPAQASCFLFGNSGSGVVRTFKGQDIDQYALNEKIEKFDLVINWGILYWLVKPMFFI